MLDRKLKLIIVLLLAVGLTGVKAQEAILSSGGEASGDGGSVSYSVGQAVYATATGTNGSLAQGVQQPFEISLITGIEEVARINLVVNTYPNPSTGFLALKVNNIKLSDLSFQLYDMNGNLLENKKIEGNETSINMHSLVSATYFLKIILNNKEIKTFKIIKY